VELQIFQQLLFEGADAAPLVVQRGAVVETAFQAVAVDGFRQEISGAAADRLKGGVQRVFAGDHDHVQPRIGAQRAIQEFVAVACGAVDSGKQQSAAPVADGFQGFFGIGRGQALVAKLGD
jgi:hypothetical protein